jgi:CheY-like chemotaxis protein
MIESPQSPTRDEFANWMCDALNRLYDSPYLQTHPLADAFADRENDALVHRSQNLRRILFEAIRAMRPNSGVPAQSPDWRAYRILELRYIEGLSPSEVMDQLALGRSQYYRDQARVLEALTDVLWHRWQKARGQARSAADESSTPQEDPIHSETDRLIAHATWEMVNVGELLDDLQITVAPLARAKEASVCFVPPDLPVVLNADRVMLRQAVLNLVTYALDIARGGRSEIGGFAEASETGIHVIASWEAAATAQPTDTPRRLGRGLDICRQLTAAMGGTLRLENEGRGHWEARLAWPVSVSCVLLVVDDNEDLVDLFRRYLAGYKWQVIGASNGVEARRIITEGQPTLIALDVMMPEEDGWEFLLALKRNEGSRNTPVIVCSVLNEPQLALELGAVAYLQKPVTQQALLQALAPWSQGGANLGSAR